MSLKDLTLPNKNEILIQVPSPVQELKCPLFDRKDVRVFIKREDLIHPEISGNKWRKLKHNLKEATDKQYEKLITFGGAYSNHIAATAAAGYYYDLPTLGIIRGEKYKELNPTLCFAQKMGMSFEYVSREEYKLRNDPEWQKQFTQEHHNSFIVPEGGSNKLALQGLQEMCNELEETYSHVFVPCGSGGTIAGISAGLKETKSKIFGVPVLKNGGFIINEITSLIDTEPKNVSLLLDYHFGGYAKIKTDLIAFKYAFETYFNIELDPVYTAKTFFACFDQLRTDQIPKGSNILLIHTGGLQGNLGMKDKMELLQNNNRLTNDTLFD